MIAGIILAAGTSKRFGPANKLLAPVDGIPLVRRTVTSFVDADLDVVLVVVGHEAQRVGQALMGLPVQLVENPDFSRGQSRSLVTGIEALPEAAEAAIIGVADQPFLRADTIGALAQRFLKHRSPLVLPRFGGVRGTPTLFRCDLFGELVQVQGDEGGRAVVERHLSEAVWVDVMDSRGAADVDTRDDLPDLGLDG